MISPRYISRPPWAMPMTIYPAALRAVSAPRRLVEIGPGRGDFLFHLARHEPQALVYGIEIKRRRFCKLIERREQLALTNVALVHGDARLALPDLFSAAPVDTIYVQFPDPWPKRRHMRNRLVNTEFLALCGARLVDGGEFWFVTDFQPYADTVATLVAASPGWTSVYPDRIVTESPDAYPTFFAEKWRTQGRTIYYQRYRKDRSSHHITTAR